MCVCLKDLLRGFGAWSLVSWVAYGRDRYAPGAERLGGAEPGGGWTLSAAVLLPRHGDLAVPLSFLVSGLVLFWPYATRTRAMETPGDVLAFWRRRTARLLPLYWLSVLFGSALAYRPVDAGTGEGAEVDWTATWETLLLQLSGGFTFRPREFYAAAHPLLWLAAAHVAFGVLFPLLAFAARRLPWAFYPATVLLAQGARMAAQVENCEAEGNSSETCVPGSGFNDCAVSPGFGCAYSFRQQLPYTVAASLDLFAAGMALAAVYAATGKRPSGRGGLGQVADYLLMGVGLGLIFLAAYVLDNVAVQRAAFADRIELEPGQDEPRLVVRWYAYVLVPWCTALGGMALTWGILPRPDDLDFFSSVPRPVGADAALGDVECAQVCCDEPCMTATARRAGANWCGRGGFGPMMWAYRTLAQAVRITGRASYSLFLWHGMFSTALIGGRVAADARCARGEEGCTWERHHDVLALALACAVALTTYRCVEFREIGFRRLFCLDMGLIGQTKAAQAA